LIKDKLIRLSEVKGFKFVEQDNKYRSQRCNKCGWTHGSNRKGKTFKCSSINCTFGTDSDLNADSNHEVNLVEITQECYEKQLRHLNGFYWFEDKIVDHNGECIVPHVH